MPKQADVQERLKTYEVQGVGEVVCVEGGFYKGWRVLNDFGIRPVNSKELARLWREMGTDHSLWQRRTYTRDAIIRIPPRRLIYIRDAPIDADVAQIFDSTSNGRNRSPVGWVDEYTHKEKEESIRLNFPHKPCYDRTVMSGFHKVGAIRLEDVPDESLMQMLFGEQVYELPFLLGERGIRRIPIYVSSEVEHASAHSISYLPLTPELFHEEIDDLSETQVIGLRN